MRVVPVKQAALIALTVIVLLLAAVLCLSLRASIANADGETEQVGYLVDEDFSFVYTRDGDVKVSGWDIRRAGGSLSYAYHNFFRITDSSTSLPVSLTRSFREQSGGAITLEYRFKPSSAMDDTKWLLLGDGSEIAAVALKSGSLVWEGPGGQTSVLQAYTVGSEYGVRAIADLDHNTADVYVNGILRATAVPLKQAAAELDAFEVRTGVASTGSMDFGPVKIYKGYVVNEKFTPQLAGTWPQDWQPLQSGGTIAVQMMESATRPDIFSGKLAGAAGAGRTSVSRSIPVQTDRYIFEYNVLIPVKADGLRASLTAGGVDAFVIETSGGQLCYKDAEGQLVPFYDYMPNVWYKVKVKLDPATLKVDVFVNSKLKVPNASLPAAADSIDGIQYSVPGSASSVMWVDDIQLYRDEPLPSDYVPEPVLPEVSSDKLIGMQSCSLWREGYHLGWDPVAGFSERTPLLGYYDEGKPETADWEIKWMAEHGVDFQLYCWFRPQGSAAAPIKDPYLGNALNDGYLNAQYSDKMKFAIMWENTATSAKTSSDFRNNLIPYWIEYYFKDPRYMVIDNKPVLSIYSLSGLVRDFGSIAGAKSEIDYLRSAVQQAGFDDIVLITSYNGIDQQAMSDRKSAGFDAIYAYSFGMSSGHAAYPQSILDQQKVIGGIDILPTVSMGRDDIAWGLSDGYYASPEEFQSALQWARDTFMPSLPSGNLGRRIIMLDDWNEFGEGHFIMPAQLAGFGYVDAIRSVFTSGGTHEDIIPATVQKDRISVLYPQGRVSPFRAPIEPPVTTQYVKSWEFNSNGDSEGWGLEKQVYPLVVADGAYSGTSVGTDPGIRSSEGLSIDAAEAQYIVIRMKASLPSNGQLFFITDKDTTWDESKSSSIFIDRTDGYVDYYVNVWKNKKWAGKIKQIRFDPMMTPGQFSIDSIRVMHTPIAGMRLTVDGMLLRPANAPVLTNGVPMVPASDTLKQAGIIWEWDAKQQELIAVRGSSIIRYRAGSTVAYKNNTPIALQEAPALLADGTLMLPANSLQQTLGLSVNYDSDVQRISIYTAAVVWNFNGSTEEWTGNSQVSNLRAESGSLMASSLGTEPAVTSKEQLAINASLVKRVRVREKQGTPGDGMKLYFTTTADPVWNDTKSMAIRAVSNDSMMREYVFDTSGFSAWTGTLDQIRLVPASAAGSFAIDSIQLDMTPGIEAVGDNLVANPGMEFSPFTYSGFQSTRTLTSSEAHSGHQSLNVVKTGAYGSLYFGLPIQNGVPYRYSVWAKLGAQSTNGEVLRLCLQYKLDGVTKQMIIFTSSPLTSSSWTQVSGTYTIQESGTVSDVSMYMYTDNPATTDSFYLDDVEVRPVTTTTDPAWVYVTGVSLDQQSLSVTTGSAAKLTATVQPGNAINRSVVWTTDHPEVAIADAYGDVYAVGPGTAALTVSTIEGDYKAGAVIQVNAVVPVTGISVSEPAMTVAIGSTGRLTPTVQPDDATIRSVTWSSANPKVATVDAVGNVKAVGYGQTTITVTTADSGYKAYAQVTVPINAVTGDNLIIDSGMEGAAFAYAGNQPIPVTLAKEAHTGNQSILVKKQSAYSAVWFPLPLTAGDEYAYSVWVKPAAPSSDGEVLQLCLQYFVDGVKKQAIILSSEPLRSTEWTLLEGIYAIKDTGNITNVFAYLYTDRPAAADSFYLDDFVMRPVLGYDLMPPVTVDDAHTDWATPGQLITLSASDNQLGVADTRYSLDGQSYRSGSEVRISGDGVHTLRYYSMDKAGNREIENAVEVKIDGRAPTVTWQGVADDQTYLDQAVPTIQASDEGSGVSIVELLLDGHSWTSGTPVSDRGTHTLQAVAIDRAGNRTIAEIRFKVVSPTRLTAVDAQGVYSDPVVLTACLTDLDGKPIAGGEVRFSLNGTLLGKAVTDAYGTAALPYVITQRVETGFDSKDYVIQTDYSPAEDSYRQATATQANLQVWKETASIAMSGMVDLQTGRLDIGVVLSENDETSGDRSDLPVRLTLWKVQPDLSLATVSQSVYRSAQDGHIAGQFMLPPGLYIAKAELLDNDAYQGTSAPPSLFAIYDSSGAQFKLNGAWTGTPEIRLDLRLSDRPGKPGSQGNLHVEGKPGGANLELMLTDWSIPGGAAIEAHGRHGGSRSTLRLMPDWFSVGDEVGQLTVSLKVWQGDQADGQPVFATGNAVFTGTFSVVRGE